jgi:hypothetical protein
MWQLNSNLRMNVPRPERSTAPQLLIARHQPNPSSAISL